MKSDQVPKKTFQRNITATVFGGSGENEPSAYDGHRIGEAERCLALPFRFKGKRKLVQLINSAKPSKTALGSIQDVGPWLVDDDYFKTGKRPIAEICHVNKEPLPRGPNKGKIPSNGAGIDLSPALARALGIKGMGK